MYWDVITVTPISPLSLSVEFADGLTGEIHFQETHLTGVFEVLKDANYFNQVFVENGIVTWPGELDLAPDAMYAEISKYGVWQLY